MEVQKIEKLQSEFPEILDVIREEPVEITFYSPTQVQDSLGEVSIDWSKKEGSTCDAAWSYPFDVSSLGENGEIIIQRGKVFMSPFINIALNRKFRAEIEGRLYKISNLTNFGSHIEMEVELLTRSSVKKTA